MEPRGNAKGAKHSHSSSAHSSGDRLASVSAVSRRAHFDRAVRACPYAKQIGIDLRKLKADMQSRRAIEWSRVT